MGNLRLEAEIRGVRDRVENGSSLHEAMAQASHFPPDLARIVSVGEQTGRLPEMLSRIGRSYNSEVRRHYQRLVTLVEPALIVFMGVVIGIVALSLILPMLRATKSFQG
jgi:type II secretory pathway component PulF